MLLITLIGVTAGLITTITGFGGGLLLVTVLAVIWDPLSAITITSIALLVGNAQRLYMFRRHPNWRMAGLLIVGAIPGSLIGAQLAGSLPTWVLQLAIVAVTGAALLRAVWFPRWKLPVRSITPGAASVGMLAAVSGGGGFLLGPLMLSAGLSGAAFIATGAMTASAIHTGRVVGYSAAGLLEVGMIATALKLAACIIVGNMLGRRLRHHIDAPMQRWFEYGAMVTCAAAAVIGTLTT